MFKNIAIAVVIFAVASFAAAQGNKGSKGRAAEAPETTTCAFTFNTGAGLNATQYCVTANGNITQFSAPAGLDHIAGGVWPSEGYSLCDFTPATPVAYYDYATNDSGNWGSSTVLSSSASAVKFVRTTSDGIWQITQTITKGAASAKSPGSAKIAMIVKNLSGIARTAYVYRYADIDANNDYTTDDFMSGFRQLSGQDAFWYGLSMTSNTDAFIVDTLILDSNGVGPDPCNPLATYVPSATFHGDGGGVLWFAATFPKAGSKTFNMTYKPY